MEDFREHGSGPILLRSRVENVGERLLSRVETWLLRASSSWRGAAGDRTRAVAEQFESDQATVWRACHRYQTEGVVGLLADGRKEHSRRHATISSTPARSDRGTGLLEALGQVAAHHPRLQ
jgi:hypothetical protein